jgi:predicted kinase
MKIGLTGGIASGKSTVARYLAQLGAHVIDADVLGQGIGICFQPRDRNLLSAAEGGERDRNLGSSAEFVGRCTVISAER